MVTAIMIIVLMMKVRSGNTLCQCVQTNGICHGVYPGEVCNKCVTDSVLLLL